jgi:flagellar secretion chaperone FliS
MWKDAYFDGRILSADPLELVHILYEHTLTMVRDGRQYLAEGNIPARGRAITRAIAALDELDGSLDRRVSGSISRNLAALYQYMRLRLLTANLQQQDAPLKEVESLLVTLGEAWSAIRHSNQPVEREMAAVGAAFGAFAAEPQAEFAGQGWSA